MGQQITKKIKRKLAFTDAIQRAIAIYTLIYLEFHFYESLFLFRTGIEVKHLGNLSRMWFSWLQDPY